MIEPEVRVRWWQQDTLESGHFEVTGLMPLSHARAWVASRDEGSIVQDEEGWPLFDCGGCGDDCN